MNVNGTHNPSLRPGREMRPSHQRDSRTLVDQDVFMQQWERELKAQLARRMSEILYPAGSHPLG